MSRSRLTDNVVWLRESPARRRLMLSTYFLPGAADAVQAATRFLERQSDPYAHAVQEDAPIGAELIVPQLCGALAVRCVHATRHCCRCGKRA